MKISNCLHNKNTHTQSITPLLPLYFSNKYRVTKCFWYFEIEESFHEQTCILSNHNSAHFLCDSCLLQKIETAAFSHLILLANSERRLDIIRFCNIKNEILHLKKRIGNEDTWKRLVIFWYRITVHYKLIINYF